MKNYSSCKNIIKQKYNPENKHLSRGKFEALQAQYINGDMSVLDELFQLTCFDAYDFVAHLYVDGLLHFDFEDALQETFVILHKMRIGDILTRSGKNYFLKISNGIRFGKYEKEILTRLGKILNELDLNEQAAQTPFEAQSNKINSLLTEPEKVAIAELSRPDIKATLLQAPLSPHQTRTPNDPTIDHYFDGKSYQEIAKERNVSRQRVYKVCNKTINCVKSSPESKEKIRELLS